MNIQGTDLERIVNKNIDREWEYIKTIDFPKLLEHEIPEKSMINEWKNLCKKELSWKTRSSIVIKFNPSLIFANKYGKYSPYEYWQKLKVDKNLFKKFYENRLKCSDWYNEKPENWEWLLDGKVPEFIYGIGLSTSGKAPRVSYFKPAQMQYLIKKYANEFDAIFDPFAGYAGRLIGTLACNKNYIGYDLSDMVIEEDKKCSEWLSQFTSNTYDLQVKDSLKSNGSFDCLITCPPYSNIKGKQIEEWRKSDMSKISCTLTCDEIIDKCLALYNCKKYIFVVDGSVSKYKNKVIDIFTNTNYINAREGKLTEQSKNHECVVLLER